jgi:prophage antirepressor-like protein
MTTAKRLRSEESSPPDRLRFRRFVLGTTTVRGFIDGAGAPWIIAVDLAEPLELAASTVRGAIARLPAKDRLELIGNDLAAAQKLLGRKNGSWEPQLPKKSKYRGAHTLIAISEGAAYSIILRSNAALREGTFAFQFREWITGDVIPSLRREGAYVVRRKDRALLKSMPGYAEARQKGIATRHAFTDTVKAFVAYCVAQGSNNASRYYGNLTKLVNKVVIGIESPPGGRGALGVWDLLQIGNAERNLARLLEREMVAKTEYHLAFANAKATLTEMFSTTLPTAA